MYKRFNMFFLPLIIILVAGCASSRTGIADHPDYLPGGKPDIANLERLIIFLTENKRALGSVSVFWDGAEIYTGQIGYRDQANDLYIDANTEFRIGSISKTFLAVVIMQMVEEGSLTLETKLSDFFPQITNSEIITIRHILQHRSGIYNYTDDETFPEWMFTHVNRESLLHMIAGYESIFEPGTEESYSNSNFFVLALIAETIDGIIYEEIIQRRIAEPLGLRNTYVGGAVNPQRNEALPYAFTGEWVEIITFDPSVIFGAGDLVSTPYDLNVFFTGLFGGDLVSTNSLDEMINLGDPIPGSFGLGLIPVHFYDRSGFGHTGGMPGFQSFSFYFPADRISISYTTNGIRLSMNNILFGVLSSIFIPNYEVPVIEETIMLPAEVLERYIGVYQSRIIPLIIHIFIENDILMAQAEGQSAFPLDAIDEFNFVFEPALIHMEFFPESGEMTMSQAGYAYEFYMIDLYD